MNINLHLLRVCKSDSQRGRMGAAWWPQMHAAVRSSTIVCCRNTTPADNLSQKCQNAQKVGSCLFFLLHGLMNADQIGAELSKSGRIRVSSAGGDENRPGLLKVDGEHDEESRFVSNGASNGIGVGYGGRHGRKGRQGAAASRV